MKKKGRRFLSLLIVILVGGPLIYAQDKTGSIPRSKESKLGPLQKSLILPGWGQLSERRYVEGIFFLASEIFCVYHVLDANHKGNTYYQRYKAADNVEDAVRYRELTERYDKRRNQGILIAAGIWAVNLLDISLIVRNKERKDKRAAVVVKTDENGSPTLSISLTF